MSRLFTPIKLLEIAVRNRIFVAPMCQYSSTYGMPNDWHLVHLGGRAVGGAGMVIVEATAVLPEGRITPGDTGIWNDAQAQAFRRITTFIAEQGAVPAIQLAHAGRKASTAAPWEGDHALTAEQGGWQVVGPSAVAFSAKSPTPRAMMAEDLRRTLDAFVTGARRSLEAGFQAVELHMAHGYLLHEFLSPLANLRTDEYGGSLEGRMRFPLEVARAVREVWPARLPLLVRISATDWKDGGWDIEQSVAFCRKLKEIGVDLIDCSSGGMAPDAKVPAGPGYQVPFAERIRHEVGIATGAVGLLTQAEQAEEIIAREQADVVLLARELLRNPYWPLQAAKALGVDLQWPRQYARAKAR